MRGKLLLIVLFSLVLWSYAAIGDWELCSNASTSSIAIGSSRLVSTGTGAKVLTFAPNGTLVPAWLEVVITSIQEWSVSNTQLPCRITNSPPLPPGTVRGTLTARSSLSASDFLCRSQYVNLTLANGVKAERIFVEMRHTSLSNFSMHANWTHSLGYYNQTFAASVNSENMTVIHQYRYVEALSEKNILEVGSRGARFPPAVLKTMFRSFWLSSPELRTLNPPIIIY